MSSFPYIFSLSRPEGVKDNLKALFPIMGWLSPLQGSTTGGTHITIYITRTATKKKEKLLGELDALGVYSAIRLVKLSDPMSGFDLSELRDLYREARYDTSRLTDDELRMYVSDLLQHQHRYYLHSSFIADNQFWGLSLKSVPAEHLISDEQRKLLIEEEQKGSFPELITETVICNLPAIEDDEPPCPPLA